MLKVRIHFAPTPSNMDICRKKGDAFPNLPSEKFILQHIQDGPICIKFNIKTIWDLFYIQLQEKTALSF